MKESVEKHARLVIYGDCDSIRGDSTVRIRRTFVSGSLERRFGSSTVVWLTIACYCILGFAGCDDAVNRTVVPGNMKSAESPVSVETRDPDAESNDAKPADPVGVTAKIFPSDGLDGTVTLEVQLTIADGWYVFPMAHQSGPNAPTEIDLQLPEGLQHNAEWDSTQPTPKFTPGLDSDVHEKEAIFRTQLQRSGNPATPPVELTVIVRYQACSLFRCLPASSITTHVRLP